MAAPKRSPATQATGWKGSGGGCRLPISVSRAERTRALLPLDPFAFNGASQVNCTLLDGAIRDFNLIYAPDRYSARLQWLEAAQPKRFFTSAAVLLIFSVCDQLHVGLADNAYEVLGRHDCMRLDGSVGLQEVAA